VPPNATVSEGNRLVVVLPLQLRKARSDLGKVLEPRRALGQVPLELPQFRPLVSGGPRPMYVHGVARASAVRGEFALAGNSGCSGVHVELPEDVLEVRSDSRA